MMIRLASMYSGRMQRYAVGGFWLGFPQAVTFAVALLTLPVVLGKLAIGDYGQFQLVLALYMWLGALTAEYVTAGAKEGIAQGYEGTFLHAMFARLKLVIPVGLLTGVVGVLIMKQGLHILGMLLLVLAVFLVVGYLPSLGFSQVFVAKKQFRTFGIWESLHGALTLLFAAAAAYATGSVIWFAVAHFGAITLIGWIGFLAVTIRHKMFEAWRKGKIKKGCVSYGFKLIPAAVFQQSAERASAFLVGGLFGFASLAVFSVAFNMFRRSQSSTKILYALFYADFATKDFGRLFGAFQRQQTQLLLFATAGTLGLVVGMYGYVTLLLPPAYGTAFWYFALLSLVLPAGVMQIILHTMLTSHLRHRELTWVLIALSTVRLFLVGLLGAVFGVFGVIVALVAAGWFDFGVYYAFCAKVAKTSAKANEAENP